MNGDKSRKEIENSIWDNILEQCKCPYCRIMVVKPPEVVCEYCWEYQEHIWSTL